ncbi:hypothetical protein DFH08DRAFT_974740 [Mycena albidolilacea]|uniref:Uncharacterized protein n=1 Tax=Mycena albidolilacea TaxID=1033008 RepID=A0AAD6Z7B8_9AGAR|nr:hypothetical protein DFH08DRAFT_974740 [Mycena albidolilacea]
MTTHHIVAMLPPAWGHTISYIYVAVQMHTKDPTLLVTIVQHSIVVSQMEAELATCSYDKTRLRIIGMGNKDIPRVGPNGLEENFHQLADGWMNTIPRPCQGTDGWPKPQTIHLDFGCGGLVIEETKKILGPECKVLVWCSSALASMPACLNEYDFAAIARKIFSDENKRNGRSMNDILLQAPIELILPTAQTLAKVADGYTAFLSSDPNPVAFELLQIRTGPQLGPSLRGGPRITGTVVDATEELKVTFDAARGARGATLRTNVIRLAEALKESAAGEASEEIIRLAKF